MKKKIMIVDDETDIQAYLMAALEDSGYSTCTVNDINDILGSIYQEKPDLIILDIMMPDRSGISIYREIQQTPEFKTIPIILMSGLSSKNDFIAKLFHDKKKSDEIAVPDVFMEKPIQLEKLEKQISNLLK
jgi:DNA-binding response OmpR family regulator